MRPALELAEVTGIGADCPCGCGGLLGYCRLAPVGSREFATAYARQVQAFDPLLCDVPDCRVCNRSLHDPAGAT